MTAIQIKVPNWLDKICVLPLLLYRKLKYDHSFRKIPLGEGKYTIVDPRDFYWVNNFHWSINGKGEDYYAVRNFITAHKKTKMVYLHREIMKAPKKLVVDHRNNNGLDNRRFNLRLATHSENMQNRRKNGAKTSSRFNGVSFHKPTGQWSCAIHHQGKYIWLGRFDSEIEAAKAYDEAARKYHGEFARLNFT